nr:pyridoxal phosphate-dependent aminotransferase [Bacteroidales bacterium]
MNKYLIPEGSLISFMSDKVKHFGGINLAQGLPGFSPPVALLDFLSEISTDISLQQYAPGNGDKRLLELIYSHYSKFSNYKQDNFVVVNGATEAISIIFTYIYNLIDKPYSVLAFNPAYESYINLPKIFNLPYIPFSFEDDLTIDFNKLEDTIKKEKVKLLFVNTPGNPLGKIWSENEINKIIELAEKLDVYIILDAVYKEIYFDKPPYLPYNYTGNRVFYVNSFSKLLSITGWRIGYFYAGDTHIRKLKTIHDYIGLCSPSLLQKAIAGYIDNNDFGITYSAGLRQKINISFKLLHTALINK